MNAGCECNEHFEGSHCERLVFESQDLQGLIDPNRGFYAPNQDGANKKDGMSTGGAVVLSLFLIGLVVGMTIYLVRRRRRQARDASSSSSSSFHDHHSQVNLWQPPSLAAPSLPSRATSRSWHSKASRMEAMLSSIYEDDDDDDKISGNIMNLYPHRREEDEDFPHQLRPQQQKEEEEEEDDDDEEYVHGSSNDGVFLQSNEPTGGIFSNTNDSTTAATIH